MRAIIFDLDDTLYPEIEFVMSGFRTVAKVISQDFGFEADKIYSMLAEAFEVDRKYVFNRVLENLKINNEDYLSRLICIYRTHKPEIHLYKDAEEMLPYLKTKFKLGLITDGIPITQKLKIKALGIENYFEKIIYTGEKDVNYSKPSIAPFKDMLGGLNIQPDRALYIGDNKEKDFKGPKDIGIKSIMILRNGIYKDAIAPGLDFEPDLIIGSLYEISGIIGKL
jgi:putative hydrolase of the HAD superfamily